jgi:hypothetical protein
MTEEDKYETIVDVQGLQHRYPDCWLHAASKVLCDALLIQEGVHFEYETILHTLGSGFSFGANIYEFCNRVNSEPFIMDKYYNKWVLSINQETVEIDNAEIELLKNGSLYLNEGNHATCLIEICNGVWISDNSWINENKRSYSDHKNLKLNKIIIKSFKSFGLTDTNRFDGIYKKLNSKEDVMVINGKAVVITTRLFSTAFEIENLTKDGFTGKHQWTGNKHSNFLRIGIELVEHNLFDGKRSRWVIRRN